MALQLGGDDPKALAECAGVAQKWGYTEVNINVGCPSDRVKNGQFGATLMARPELVAQCVDAVMIGRAAYDNPTLFAAVDKRFFGVQERAIGSD